MLTWHSARMPGLHQKGKFENFSCLLISLLSAVDHENWSSYLIQVYLHSPDVAAHGGSGPDERGGGLAERTE